MLMIQSDQNYEQILNFLRNLEKIKKLIFELFFNYLGGSDGNSNIFRRPGLNFGDYVLSGEFLIKKSKKVKKMNFFKGFVSSVKDKFESLKEDLQGELNQEFNSQAGSKAEKQNLDQTGIDIKNFIENDQNLPYLIAIRLDGATFLDSRVEPNFESKFELKKFAFLAQNALKIDEGLGHFRNSLVPEKIKDEEFWVRYFYYCNLALDIDSEDKIGIVGGEGSELAGPGEARIALFNQERLDQAKILVEERNAEEGVLDPMKEVEGDKMGEEITEGKSEGVDGQKKPEKTPNNQEGAPAAGNQNDENSSSDGSSEGSGEEESDDSEDEDDIQIDIDVDLDEEGEEEEDREGEENNPSSSQANEDKKN